MVMIKATIWKSNLLKKEKEQFSITYHERKIQMENVFKRKIAV